jgi:glycosyltransferase involved in cell wall biosynthesis
MKHIVIDCRESGTTTGRYLDKLVENLQKIDNINRYTLLYHPENMESIEIINPNFSKVATKYLEFSFGEQFGFALQLYRLKPDLVHFFMVQQPLLYFGKSVTGILDLTPLRFHNPATPWAIWKVKSLGYLLMNWVAAKRSKHIIFISEYVRNQASSMFGIPPVRSTVTYNAADLITDTAEPVNELVGKEFIMFVGRHFPHKNLQRLMYTHELLQKVYPDLVLAIVGKTDSVSARLQTQNSKLTNLVFTGFVSDAQLKWLYQNTACYCFPSLSEGFGLPGIEAMLHGAPVASSSATCLPEVNGEAAVYFDPLDIDDMARVIDRVISDPLLAKDMITKGKAQAAKYSWQKTAQQTLEIYNNL